MNREDLMRDAAVIEIPRIRSNQGTANSPRAWLREMPSVFAGSWDDEPIFFRRVGGQSTWEEADYHREHTEAAITKLKDMGVTLVTIDFFKGFGLEAEKDHIDLARQLAAMLHQQDIRVGLYVGSTVAFETFLLEAPDAQEWFVPDYLGRPVVYDGQSFRKRVYFMHPGYVEYMKRVVRVGVEDLKADLIHFDNTSLQGRPEIFQHPMAVKDFREYLQGNYSAAELKQRLGFSDVRYVIPPKIDWPVRVIEDPLFQLWTAFRCRRVNEYYAVMERFIRGLNPATVLYCNPSSGLSGTNTIWFQGISYPGICPQVDIVRTEERNYAEVTPEGILVSTIRSYKMGSIMGTQISAYTAGTGHYGGKGTGTAAMAESMAFNRQSIGSVGGILDAPEIPEGQKRYIQFFHQNFDYYKGVQNIADVGVLYSYASMGFNNDRPWVSFMLFTQALIQSQVPFDILFDEHLKDLSKYRVLVLADQESLSDDQMELVRKYVKQGGGLVATEQSSLYTERRLRRPDFGLKDLFKVSAPPWQGTNPPIKDVDITPVQNLIGQGRAVYIPSVRPATPKPPVVPMSSRYWKLPLNWEELIEGVKWAAAGRLSLEVKTPDSLALVAELIEQPEKDRRLVHLINYAGAQGKTIDPVEVSAAIPQGKRVQEVTLLTPDGPPTRTVTAKTEHEYVHFTVPGLRTYTLAVIRLE